MYDGVIVSLQSAAAKGLFYCPVAKVVTAEDEPALDCSTAVSRNETQVSSPLDTHAGSVAVLYPRSHTRKNDCLSRTTKVAFDSRKRGEVTRFLLDDAIMPNFHLSKPDQTVSSRRFTIR
jgi:hypothetical protein